MTMMKQMKRWPAFLLPALLACACGPGSENAGGIRWKEIPLAMDSLAIDQILVPAQMQIKGDLAVVMSGKTDTIFHVFSLPDFHFLYKDGVSGEGPDDFSFGEMVSYPSESAFAKYEILKREVRVLGVTEDGFETEKVLRRSKGLGNVLSVVNDSLLIMENVDWRANKLGICVYNCKQGQVTDTLSGLKSYAKNTRIGYTMMSIFNYYSILGYGDRFVLSYYLMDRLEFFRVSPEGKIALIKGMGEEEMPDALKSYLQVDTQLKGRNMSSVPELQNPRLFYGRGGYATKDHVFLISAEGMTSEERDEKQKNGELGVALDVFTWDGDPVGRMHLPWSDVFGRVPFAVSEKYRTIYASDPQRDFDQVYTFKYDKL